MVYRVYVEKKRPFAVEAASVLSAIRSLLQIETVTDVRMFNRYDIEGISEELFLQCIPTVFSEPQTDLVTFEPPCGGEVFAVEYLPGQFDQRADSASECVQLISQGERPAVQTARVYLLEGAPSAEQVAQIKKYLINPVEAREASLAKKGTLAAVYPKPAQVAVLEGFTSLDKAGLTAFLSDYALAMDEGDLACCRDYFKEEGREPTLTEIRMIDTYWSDHCRHTTFHTTIDAVFIGDEAVKNAYRRYLSVREELSRKKPINLMDIATIAARYLKTTDVLNDLDESDEINACSVKIKVNVDDETQDWLLMFKNETHNHPTEIEPFGGAATCIGGAIRDPLSGRSYVYQAMRVTGAADPLTPVSETLPGKLPQRTIVTSAAAGYSSYGNQIGLATGQVDEIYHPGYVAKRMEVGAVIGAAPEENVRRETPLPGDIVLLLGGATGRDGCGGATGSSKAHKKSSLEECGAEVQKGNAPVERKLQRLFRDKSVSTLIKRCNDFGAGGVSVAIGELADGLSIDLDAIPKKYDGLDGTELAISESQERMAVVVAPGDEAAFLAAAARENVQATKVAVVTENPRLVMCWQGSTIVNVSRAFLNSNGAEKHMTVTVSPRTAVQKTACGTLNERFCALVSDLNVCGKKGLVERFDSTIGAATVLMPFGGEYQLTPAQAMVAKLPVTGLETTTCTGMAYGFNPYIGEQSEFTGAYLAVVESISKLVAAGFIHKKIYLSFQEYFEKLGSDPARWGRPFAALLGALSAQLDLEIAAIGGKDSMSGSFEKLDVPPTLVSFAVAAGHTAQIISPEFKQPGSKVVLLTPKYSALQPEADSLLAVYRRVEGLIAAGKVRAAYTPCYGGIAEALFKMCLGNRFGFRLADGVDVDSLFAYRYGSFVLELASDEPVGTLLGETCTDYTFNAGKESLDLASLQALYEAKLAPVYPYTLPVSEKSVPAFTYSATERKAPKIAAAKPHVLIPVFPGTNCEYDSARAMRRAGAEAEVFVIQNLTPAAIAESVKNLAAAIQNSQIVLLPGGFSGGDEPDGSGKFITAAFRSPAVREAVSSLLTQRDGLMLGICNGYQALIKLGLVPYGEIREMDENCPTLTFNTIGRHQSRLVNTRVASNKSPWLQFCEPGEIFTLPVSHGEGRFVASDELVRTLAENGQIACQYVDLAGSPTMDVRYNPNGSAFAVEAITSPDGRVLGKMCHSERNGLELYKNVPGNKYQKLFEGGVAYFK